MRLGKTDPKILFLIDACGALLSAFLLGVILTRFEPVFGMPRNVLYILAIIPCFFALFSFFNYFKYSEIRRHHLRTIAVLNLSYCMITATLVLYFFSQLTALGIGYFIVEMAIVVGLSVIELKASKRGGHISGASN